MRIGSLWKRARPEIGFGSKSVFVSTERVEDAAESVLSGIASRERDKSWYIGDQAMNKTGSGNSSTQTGGCSA
jgi:hypothetical protein